MSSFEMESSHIILILQLYAILIVLNYTEQQKNKYGIDRFLENYHY